MLIPIRLVFLVCRCREAIEAVFVFQSIVVKVVHAVDTSFVSIAQIWNDEEEIYARGAYNIFGHIIAIVVKYGYIYDSTLSSYRNPSCLYIFPRLVGVIVLC